VAAVLSFQLIRLVRVKDAFTVPVTGRTTPSKASKAIYFLNDANISIVNQLHFNTIHLFLSSILFKNLPHLCNVLPLVVQQLLRLHYFTAFIQSLVLSPGPLRYSMVSVQSTNLISIIYLFSTSTVPHIQPEGIMGKDDNPQLNVALNQPSLSVSRQYITLLSILKTPPLLMSEIDSVEGPQVVEVESGTALHVVWFQLVLKVEPALEDTIFLSTGQFLLFSLDDIAFHTTASALSRAIYLAESILDFLRHRIPASQTHSFIRNRGTSPSFMQYRYLSCRLQ